MSYDGGNGTSKSSVKISSKCNLDQDQVNILKTFFDNNDITYTNNDGERLISEYFRNVEQDEEDFCSITLISISSKNDESVPSEIGEIVNLTSLSINMEKLSVIPPEIGNLGRLTNLAIYNTQIQTLPSAIGNLYNLEKLQLANNNISRLPSEMVELKNLDRLILEGNSGLGNLNTSFSYSSTKEKIQENITTDGKTLSIRFESYGVVIDLVE